MALNADISVKLDAGALIGTFTAALGGHGVQLNAIAVPADQDQVGAATAGTSSLDSAGIESAIAQLAEQAASGLTALVPGVPSLDGIRATLTLIEQATSGNLIDDLSALMTRLGAELDGSRDAGSFGVFMRIANLLGDAPSGQTLVALLRAILGGAGVTIPPAVTRTAEILPAADSLLRAVGGLMILESVLSEAQRLTGVMAAQIDASAALGELTSLTAEFNPALVARVAATDPTDDAALQALAATVGARVDRFDALRDRLASGMGLGEATFAYLDVEQVQREVTTAATLLRDIDLAPLQRLLADAFDGLGLNRLDFAHSPPQSLPGLLEALEAQVAGIASQIDGWDAAGLAQPVTQGISVLTAPLTQLDQLIGRITVSVRIAMEAVRNVVVSLPLHGLIDVIHTVLEPVVRALAAITALVADIAAALDTAVKAALQALGDVEGTIDGFKSQVAALFGEAKTFVDGLHLDQIAGQIGEKITAFTQVLQQAQMKPYFDTATSAIGAAADVVSAVPFGLLPESMKADVDAAVKPIKDTDVDAAEHDIESALGIGPDGVFSLRGDLEHAIADVQAKYEELIATLRAHDPQQYLAQLDAKLGELAAKIRDIAPQLSLQPVQDAITQVKNALGGFDLNAALAPLQQVFDQATTTLAQYSPGQLIDPIESRITDARQKVKDAIKLDQWAPALDDLTARGTKLLNTLDPAQLQPQIEALLGEARDLAGALPDVKPVFIGSIVAQLLSGTQARLYPQTYPVVQDWISRGGGSAALTARTGRIADSVLATQAAVRTLDITALSAPLVAAITPLRAALGTLLGALAPDAPGRARIQTLVDRLDAVPLLSALAANRNRFLALLDAAATLGETVRRTGLSEVDSVITKLTAAFAPVLGLIEVLKGFVRKAGVPDVDNGLPALVRSVFGAVPPARLAAILAPIFNALRGRVLALVNAVLTPVKNGITEVNHLLDAIDLGPLKTAVDAVFNEVVAEIQALSPSTLLAEPIAAFNTLKAQVAAFDPLAPVLALLNGLRDTAARVLDKLSAQALLATPLAIYREVLDAFGALNIGALLAPVLDLLDSIAKQVDDGLDETVAAFKNLQAALPSGGGGSSLSVSISGF